jgi:hypothetical protein
VIAARVAWLYLLAYLLAVVVAVTATARAGSPLLAVASAYSTAESTGVEGCTGRRLRDDTLTLATYLVPCGVRVRVCVGSRCVTATRTDSGPHVAGRGFDLALGTVRALGFTSARAFGVRVIEWRRA